MHYYPLYCATAITFPKLELRYDPSEISVTPKQYFPSQHGRWQKTTAVVAIPLSRGGASPPKSVKGNIDTASGLSASPALPPFAALFYSSGYMPLAASPASVTWLTFSHFPERLCFHSVTLWSPQETARRFPVTLQLTRHTGALKGVSVNLETSHAPPSSRRVQIKTVWSSEQEATMLAGVEVLGAHATSRTQSSCPAGSGTGDCVQLPSGPCSQILTELSQDPVANLRHGRRWVPFGSELEPTGANEIALQPNREGSNTLSAAQESSFMCLRMVTVPSALAQPSTSPNSWGAQHTEFTDTPLPTCWWIGVHTPAGASRWITTFPS
mmetsp:Transcript_35861/g.60710  ORF Transcript_35861/g.60710 Transcript_35861/m.60710 type:complete len:326 (+) Transcript_35861:55-1032(+)